MAPWASGCCVSVHLPLPLGIICSTICEPAVAGYRRMRVPKDLSLHIDQSSAYYVLANCCLTDGWPEASLLYMPNTRLWDLTL